MTSKWIAGAALCAALLAGPATADDRAATEQFYGCDGRQGVESFTDGLTFMHQNILFNRIMQPQSEGTQASPARIQDCDAALADPRVVQPGYHLRRANLLRARAVHRLAAGQIEAALADLAAARAALPADDAWVQRSLGVGIDLVEAYALRARGDQAGSEALALRAWRTRPYNTGVTYAALVAVGSQASAETLNPLLRRLAQLSPHAAAALGGVDSATNIDRGLLARSLSDGLVDYFRMMPEVEVKSSIPGYAGSSTPSTRGWGSRPSSTTAGP